MKLRSLIVTALVAVLLLPGAAPAAAVGPGTWYGEYYVQEFVTDEFVALAICLDGAGNVYVSGWDPSNGGELRICKYSSAGTLLLTFGDEGIGNGLLEDASHMCVDKAGNIYVLDEYAFRVNKYGPTGAFIAEWNTAPGATQRPAPNGITVDAAGYIYVGEGQGDKSIRKFNSSGGLVATFVNYGSSAGQLSSVCDLEYAPSGHIYTVEGNVSRVQKFTLSGAYVTGWQVPKVVSWGIASCVAVGGGGNVYVWEGNSCGGDSRLFTYSPSGTLLSTYDPFAFGFTPDSSYWEPGEMAVDANGKIYVVDEADVYSFTGVSDPPADEPPQRLSGVGRYETAVEISKANFASAGTVVIATGENFPDALSGSGLCGAYDAPLLLTKHDALPAVVLTEIKRLGATQALIIGGTTAVNDSVKNALVGAGLTVRRFQGPGRYETAAVVAAEVAAKMGAGFGKKALVARGDSFSDALALAPFAYSQSLPILLVRPDGRSKAAHDSIAALGVTSVLVAGGPTVVPPAVVTALGVPADRAAGASRYETAVEVAKYGIAKGWATPGFVGFATGANFPDALAGGPACGASGGVMLMTPASPLHAASAAWLTANKAAVAEAQVYGGSTVISISTRLKIQSILGW